MIEPLLPELYDRLGNPVELIKWLEQQKRDAQKRCEVALDTEDYVLTTHSHVQNVFEALMSEAAQPKSVSGSGCVRLCGLVDQASRSQSEDLCSWSVSQDIIRELFDFYIEWNESDQHRSMKLVLDLITHLIKRNKDSEASTSIVLYLLNILVSIVAGKSTRVGAKSAIKALDHFVAKDVFVLDDIRSVYVSNNPQSSQESEIEIWRLFFVHLLNWMRLPFISPAAGKLIITLHRALRQRRYGTDKEPNIETWYQWLLMYLEEEPSLLEDMRNYILLPLFKADKAETLLLLQRINEYELMGKREVSELGIETLLQLAMLEAGKKVGFVEEPSKKYPRGFWSAADLPLGLEDGQETRDMSSIVLHQSILDNVLTHPSHDVRSLALSLLVTSPSTTRPYSSLTFVLLRKHLNAFFADPDAKFRVDTSSSVRDMFKRVRGAIFVLKKSIPRARAKGRKGLHAQSDGPAPHGSSVHLLYRSNLVSLPEAQLSYCLEYHENFLRWYLGFLCEELIPTASYQRHVASLKVLLSILRTEAETSKPWGTADDQWLFYNVFDATWARALMDLIMDPFEDVRSFAATALRWICSDTRYSQFKLAGIEDSTRLNILEELQSRTNDIAQRTSRADHSDGAARSSQLLYSFAGDEQQRISILSSLIERLDIKITAAEKDLGLAVLEHPLHGDLASICFTWQVVAETQLSTTEMPLAEAIQDRIVSCCERVWVAVRTILCDDSPEGYLPPELETVDGLDTKDLLSFSFRAVHESR